MENACIASPTCRIIAMTELSPSIVSIKTEHSHKGRQVFCSAMVVHQKYESPPRAN